MLTVVLELRCAATDTAIKSATFCLTQIEYDELKELADEINEQNGLTTVEVYVIA
jgi:hypothetical protein